MKSSSGKGLEVFDFKEEDELVESSAGRFTGKFGNPREESPLTKDKFLDCFSRGTDAQGMEISDRLCTDVDASDSDPKCQDHGWDAVGTSEGDCAVKGVSGLDEILVSNLISHEKHAHINHNNIGPGYLFPGCLRVNSPTTEDLSLQGPSSGNEQLTGTHPELPSDSDPVDVTSEDGQSMNASSPSTYSSDVRENEGCLEESASDHYSSDWEVENTNTAVIITPDYLIYRDRYCTESLLIFSCSCIKIVGKNAYGGKESFSSEWTSDDVSGIESQWFARFETALVKLCVRSTAETEDENLNGTSGIVELKFAVCDAHWLLKQEKIMSMDVRYKAMWKVLLDTDAREESFRGKNIECSSKRYFASFDEPFEDVIYPKGDPDAVSISKRDIELLEPETFINDTIIDFYIKYLKNKISLEDKQRFHFFNSFFFRKLADMDKDPSSASEGRAAFLRVRKWTRKVNLFEKDYIFIPVNFNLHWSLIVICHPGEVANFRDEETCKALKVPCILHMDSIKGSHKGLKNLVQSYLWEEWKERKAESSEDVSSKFFNLRFVPLELPQQENSFDCGLFLLHYVEMFLEDAPVYFNPFKITQFSNFLNMDWFLPAEASLKRASIQNLIYELLEDHSQKMPSASCNDEHHSLQFSEYDNGKENGAEFLSERQSPAKDCHGIEIKLLALSPGGAQCVPGLVFRELFEPGITAVSFPNEQFRPFDQTAPFQRFKGVMSPVQEDAVTGDQIAFSPSGRADCEPLAGNTGEACTTLSASKDFGIFDTCWNPGFSMQHEECEDDFSSPKTSSFGSQNSSEAKVDENPPQRDFVCSDQLQEMEKPRSVSPENIGCITGSPSSASSEKLEACIVEDSQEADKKTENEESKDSLSTSQDNLLASFHQDSTENGNQLGENVQSSDVDPALGSDEHRAAKRLRLMPPREGERRLTRSLTHGRHS